ncbi:hypothetical protein K493DRAFT_366972 [Basidiobolus meristosporus CBS 931.73]|uniref:Uncharacterized protein n=1 Tax=Basidiobolus meristosporus CBS 931.73 TaxID=1314790 RepID=A0A1Y1ZA02_9FUNG|nr:hypothetical protein K493DRAFT_366972 [Basidiobolus meristosporus CBS 931.73]|eukprot:ORY07108.1 hypothetical protein K493DRAFT_366972 [Basidiobolus meristosporus CBS 931.73]
MFEWITSLLYQKKVDPEDATAIDEDWLFLNLDGSVSQFPVNTEKKKKPFTKADYEIVEKLYYRLQSSHRDITREYLPMIRDRERKMIKANRQHGTRARCSDFFRNPSLRSWQLSTF